MRNKMIFWSVTVLLVVVVGGSSYLWFRSFEASDQAVVRLGTPGVSVWTTDRGRLGVLFLGPQPLEERWVLTTRSNAVPPADAPKMETLCVDHGLGFGMDRQVSISGLEMPAVSGVTSAAEGTWAARRMVMPFWAIFFGSLGLLLVWWGTLGRRIHRQDHGLCPKCAFDVSQCSHYCPKCGKGITRKSWSGDSRPTRRTGAARPAGR